MTAHRLDPLLRPQSVAVVGASDRSGSPGNEVLVNLRKGGFGGDVYAVNPGAEFIEGVKCYPSLADLPAVPQQVVFAVSDARLEACLDEAIALGVPAATVFSSLKLEGDASPSLYQRVQDKASAAGLLLHGGNCMGFFNFNDRVWISGFDTRSHGAGGNAVLLSQSGAGMSGILDCEERLYFSFAASTGQELCLSVEDYLDFVLDLPQTRVVGLFLETSRHPRRFLAALEKARQRSIPIVAIKVGRSDLAAELAVSHSGALAGSDASYQAVFDRYGVQRVDDMAQLAAAMILFAQPRPVAAGGLVTLHDSGGERQLLVDRAQQLDVPLAELSQETVAELEQLLDPGLPAINPLDAWGSGGAEAPQNMADCFAALLSDPGAALGALIHDRAPRGEIYPAYLDYLRLAQAASAKPVCLVSNHQGSGGDPRVIEAVAEGLPVIDGLQEFLVGVRCLLNYRDFLARPESPAPPEPKSGELERWRGFLAGRDALSELEAGELLRAFDIPMAGGVAIDSESALEGLLGCLQYPVVLKTAMPGIEHKSDVGGVVLGLASEDELKHAYADMAQRLGPRALLTPMVTAEGVEMILGVTRDDQFGPMVVLGLGGVHAEILQDAVALLPPFGPDAARRALARLQMAALLEEVRGRPALAVGAFCEMAARLSVMAVSLADCILEVDINPVRLMVDDCVGLDALVLIYHSK